MKLLIANTFAPEPYQLKNPIQIVLEEDINEFVATFYDANIGASGETPIIAMQNVKEMILLTYENLMLRKDEDLGPGPLRQKKILASLITR